MDSVLFKNNIPSDQELEQIKLFNGVDLASIKKLLADSPIISIKKNETLIEAGKPEESMYLVLSGRMRVQLQKNDDQPITLLEQGDSIGEISILDQQPTSGYVIADIDSRVLMLSEETLWKVVDTSHAASYNLLRTLAYRLRFGNSVIHKIHSLLREFEHDSTIDPLTGFYNRRWLNKMLERLIQRSKGGEGVSRTLSVVMMDLDYFKRFNDTHGHLAGDRALNSVARSLTAHLRPEDTITRYGGEEFLAVLPDSDLEEAAHVAERLRLAVEETELFSVEGESLPPLTMSLGIAQMQIDDNQDNLIGSADKALYRAKHSGRNRVSD